MKTLAWMMVAIIGMAAGGCEFGVKYSVGGTLTGPVGHGTGTGG